MTNAELIATIRNEIERRITDNTFGAKLELIDILAWLDTLESEKPMNPEDAMKELDEKIALVKQKKTWDGVDVDKYMDEVRGREPDNPMNLEEEINRYLHEECSSDDEPGIHEIAEHFAEWGYLRAAEKYNEIEYNRQRAEEDTPNDLEEAAENIYKIPFGTRAEDFKAGAEWQKQHDAELIEIAYNDGITIGMTKQKERMMKEAVEGEIQMRYSGCLCAKTIRAINEDKFKFGDKVRVIVLPKED